MKRKELNLTKTELEKLYITDKLSILNIAKKYNVSNSVITHMLNDYSIPLRNIGKRKHAELNNILTEDYLKQEHSINKKSIERIAKENKTSSSAIKRALDKYGIKHNTYEDYKNSKYFEEDNKKRCANYKAQLNINNIFIDKETCKSKILELSVNNKITLEYLSEYTGYSYSIVSEYINKYKLNDLIDYKYTSSYYEDEIYDFIKSLGINNIERNNRSVLDGQEIDIYIPDYKLGIEFNGDYWHNEKMLLEKSSSRSRYHQKKSLLAKEKGIFIYHIFEYEWNDKILKEKIKSMLKSMLQKNDNIVYARKCVLSKITKEEKKSFLNSFHLQGNDTSTFDFGLYYDDLLVAVMTFRSARFSKSDDYELSRFCVRDNYSVVGGASKLFKYFIDNYLNIGETIVTYNDFTKTKGNLYSILGFTLDHLASPNYVWINLKTHEIKTRYMCQMKDENKTMINAGFVKICDCGNNVWKFKKR